MKIKIGVSSCLLGEKVRFDGGHKQDRYITDILGDYFVFAPVCPELEVGMGVPRESVQLEGSVKSPRMIGNKTGEDWTDRMNKYSERRVREIGKLNLSGYILKQNSPSCGMERVRVYAKNGIPSKSGIGLFAAELMKAYPLLPVEEEGRLNDPALRENFITRVFTFRRLQDLIDSGFKRGDLVKFHTLHKYLIMAHSPKHYSEMGRLVADPKKYSSAELQEKYSAALMEALAVKATPKKHVNVLQHILGYLKNHLNGDEKKEILETIEDYYKELVPLVVPVTLLRHYVRKYKVPYIADQIYLKPHPKELMLLNHV